MADYEALKTRVQELAARVWDVPAIEARYKKLAVEGFPRKTLILTFHPTVWYNMGRQRSASSIQESAVTEEKKTFLTDREAAEYLGVSLHTLRTMEIKGSLVPFRTVNGHCGYSLSMLNEYLGKSYERPRRRESESESEIRDVSLLLPEKRDHNSRPINALSLVGTPTEVKAPADQTEDLLTTHVCVSSEDPIQVLDLGPRLLGVLRGASIHTVGELVQEIKAGRLVYVHKMGPKSMAEIEDSLSRVRLVGAPEAVDASGAPLSDDISTQADVSPTQTLDIPTIRIPVSSEDHIEVLGLSVHTFDALMRASIRTIRELVQTVESANLREVHGIGSKAILEIDDSLARVRLVDEPEAIPDQEAIAEESVSEAESHATEPLPLQPLSPPIELAPLSEVTEDRKAISTAREAASGEYLERNHIADEPKPEVKSDTLSPEGTPTEANVSKAQVVDAPEPIDESDTPLSDSTFTQADASPTQTVDIPTIRIRVSSEDSIEVLGLSARSLNGLMRASIRTIGELRQATESGILPWFVSGIGLKSMAEIEDSLARVWLVDAPEAALGPKAMAEENVAETDSHVVEAPLSQPPSPPPDPTPVDVLELSIRPYNAMRRSDITTIGQLAEMSDEEIRGVRNIGPKSLTEIKDKLKAYLAEHPLPDEAKESLLEPEPQAVEPPPPPPPSPPPDPTPLDVLELSIRPYNALRHSDITTIGQLARMSDEEITGVRNIGPKSLAEIKDKLRAHLAVHPLPTKPASFAGKPEPLLPPPPLGDPKVLDSAQEKGIPLELAETSLETLIEEWLSPLASRQMQVIRWCYGLDGEELSLEEAGDRLGLTRERVRQIQNKALGILRKSRRRPIIRFLSEFMVYLLEQAGGLMNEEQVETALRRELAIGNVNSVGVARLMFMFDANVKQFRKAKAWGLRSYPLDEVEGTQAQLAQVLEEEHAPLSIDEVITRFKNAEFYRNRQAVLRDSFILACLRVHPDISIGEDSQCSLERWKRGRTDEIILALREIGESAHYAVIAEKTNALLEPEMRTSAHNIHAILGRRTDLFARVGQGVFGLREWGLPDDGSLANAAYRVLTEAGRPLHIEAITDRVLETWSVGRSSVQAAIHNDERFYRAAPATFGLLEWEIERLDEAQPVLNICPPPLPDRWGERNTFFESVLVAREVLSEQPTTADFLEAMLEWVGTSMDKSERYLQNVLNAYYVVGLTPYIVYRRAADTPLHSTLPEIDDLQALRCFCLNCMMERLARMPEFMALLTARQPCTRIELRDWFYEPGAPLDDVKNRVRLLFNFGMLRVEKRGRYLLTPSGMQVTQELEAAGQLKYPASHHSWEQVSDSQPAWDVEFDMIDFELP